MANAPPLNVPLPHMNGNYTFNGPIWANVASADDDHAAEEDEETDSDLADEDEDEDLATAFQQPAPSSNAYILSTGLPNPNFLRLVKSFEKLVLSVVLALEVFPHLNSIRIRFVELDSQVGLANPYFEVKQGLVYGVWSDRIVKELKRVRPHWRYVELDGEVPRIEAGSGMRIRERERERDRDRERSNGGVRKRTAGRPRSVKIEAYRGIARDLIEDYLHGR
ncbi:hypothetical protein KEM56_001731 [Ascosphaera pollenicola]|nr:hypothetical protein KEM56_001731 [Ascosphaera pollenicola]